MKKTAPFLLAILVGCSLPHAYEIDLSTDSESPLRIVQVSDLHVTSRQKLYSETIRKINLSSPDLLILSGDQIESPDGLPILLEYLAGIEADCPKYAIMGNWEYWGGVALEEYREGLDAAGVKLLVNQEDRLEIRGRGVSVFGLDDHLGGAPSFDGYLPRPQDINLVLGHCPILFDRLKREYPESDCEFLMLSGHTHGGQITFFGLPIVLPEGSGEYRAGLYEDGNYRLFVSKGVGNSTVDLRVFADPEINVIDL